MPDPVVGFSATPGAGIIIASDPIAGAYFQKILLPTFDYTANSSGVIAGGYNAGEAINDSPFEWQAVNLAAGRRVFVVSASLWCEVAIAGSYTLQLFNASVAAATPGSALALTDADSQKALGMGVIKFPSAGAINHGSSVIQYPGSDFKPFLIKPAATSIFGHLIADSTVTLTGVSGTGIKINLQFEER